MNTFTIYQLQFFASLISGNGPAPGQALHTFDDMVSRLRDSQVFWQGVTTTSPAGGYATPMTNPTAPRDAVNQMIANGLAVMRGDACAGSVYYYSVA